jgi:7,8-dihydroneopterin aldolase/epimerase/oxygenase
MKNCIEVNGIQLYCYHGCLEEEAIIGGNYEVDVYMECDFWKAAKTDDLLETINYVQINEIVTEEMKIRSKLIEHVGQRIVTRMRSEVKRLDYVKVKIWKISPPINGDVKNVAIVIEDRIG